MPGSWVHLEQMIFKRQKKTTMQIDFDEEKSKGDKECQILIEREGRYSSNITFSKI